MQIIMELIRDFKSIDKNDVSLAGGKGSSLGEMTKAGISVPDGFIVLSTAFEKFLEETDLNVEIDSILETVNYEEMHTIENASEKIKALVLQAEMSKRLTGEVQKFFKKLNSKYVAVRSSATAEDSTTAAWAGQLESYLNTTQENLLENVKKCWASLFTPRAIFYRFEKDLHKQKISVAVVVQKMVESEKSGIAFSVHPVTQDRNHLIIEAGFGLGEAIVSGQITPDSYVIEKQPRRIIDKNIQTTKQILSDGEILELSELILKIENYFNFPCDIEWAFEKGKFYIVQSRPITTLTGKILVRRFQKFFTREIPLIVMEYWHKGEFEGLPKLLKGATHFNPLFVRKNGLTDVYYDMNNPDTALQPLLDFFKNNPDEFNLLVNKFEICIKKLTELVDNFKSKLSEELFNTIVEAWSYLPIWIQIGSVGENQFPKELTNKSISLRDKFQEFEYKASEIILKSITDKYPKLKDYDNSISYEEVINNKVPSIEELKKRNNNFIYFEKQVISLSTEEFAKKYNIEIYNELATIGEVNSGNYFEGYFMVPMGKRLANIHEASLKVTARSRVWEKELGVGYKTAIMNSLGEYYVDIESRDKVYDFFKNKDILYAQDYVKKLYDLRDKVSKEIKENPNQDFTEKFAYMMAYFFIIKSIFEIIYKKSNIDEQKIIEKWRNDDSLFEPLEIYYKNHPKEDQPSKEDWSWVFIDGNLKFYDKNLIFLNDGDRKAELKKVEFEDSKIIKGNSAFPGVVQGVVRLVLSSKDKDFVKNGEIIVAPMTTVDFLPIMKRALAFITDEGGITSHAAIVARELKKPCIIGTKIATKFLKDGDLVEVDANNGIVRVLL